MIDLNGEIPQVTHKASGLLSVAGCKPDFADWLDRLGPFGSGNPEPRFVIPDCRIKSMKFVGEGGAHLSCRIDDGSGTINAIAFQAGGTPLARRFWMRVTDNICIFSGGSAVIVSWGGIQCSLRLMMWLFRHWLLVAKP